MFFLLIQCDIEFNCTNVDIPHPTTIDMIAYKENLEIYRNRVLSIGGGSIVFENEVTKPLQRIYKLNKFSDISNYCKNKNLRIWQVMICRPESRLYFRAL